MDLEQMKARVKSVSAPVSAGSGGDRRGLDGFVAVMKELDARDLRLLRRSMVFFAIAAVFYLGLFVLTFIAPPDDRPGLHRAILGIIGLAFAGIGLRIRLMVRNLSSVDYAEPAVKFLLRAEKRMRFVRRQDLVFFLPLSLLLAIGATLGFMAAAERYFPSLGQPVSLVIMVVIFSWAGAIGWVLRWKTWRRRLPEIQEARRLRSGFEAAEANGEVVR
jgi:hypothetical protein